MLVCVLCGEGSVLLAEESLLCTAAAADIVRTNIARLAEPTEEGKGERERDKPKMGAS